VRRRDFISILGGAAAWPLASTAQQPNRAYRLTVLTRDGQGADAREAASVRPWQAWRDELRDRGYVEGQNLLIDRHSIVSDRQRARELVREIVARKPDLIFAPAQNAVEALKAATTTIPIVGVVADPVGSKFAASLARPGGNITGFSIDAGLETMIKRFALLKEVVPTISTMATLAPRAVWEGRFGPLLQEAALQVGVTMIGAPLDSPVGAQEYRRAFSQMVKNRIDGFYATPSLEHIVHRQLIADLAAEAKLPGIFFYRENAEAGGLMSYAVDLVVIFRDAAGYIDRILKGANPAEMPFQQPAKLELIINLKTAKALGLTVPEPLLARAAEVIE
jgi:putative ABC transport system substrate-binding protein